MERKAFHALLLSGIVAAGAMTISTDAYAQTNTDRLIDVKANTDGLPAMLTSILDAINEGVASILAAITGLQTSVDTGLGAIDTDLMAIDSDLQMIHDDLSSVDSDLQAVHDDLSAIDADLKTVHDDLTDLDADLMTVRDDLKADIEALTGSVNILGQGSSVIAGLADANTKTQESVTANSVSINEILETLASISEAVGVVQTAVVVDPEDEETASATGTELFSDDNKFSVLVSAFGQNKPTDSSYTTELTFSCTEHVFLDTASVDSPTTPFVLADGTTLDATSPVITITADGIDVYSTIFRLTVSDSKSEYRAGASFNLKPLAAGEEIKVKVSTDQRGLDDNNAHVPAQRLVTTTDAPRAFTLHDYVNASSRDRVGDRADDANVTKLEAGKADVFKLDMSWYSSSADAGCTLKSPASPTTSYTDLGETVTHALVGTGGNIQKTIETVTFTCTENTAITKVTLEGIPGSFASFANLVITTDKNKTLKFENVADIATADIADKPFEFVAGTFDVSGKIPSSAAIIAITYDTVNDGSCSYLEPSES